MPQQEIEICNICNKRVHDDQQGLFCEKCKIWKHRACVGMAQKLYYMVSKSDQPWYCEECIGQDKAKATNSKTKQQLKNYTLNDVMEKLETMEQNYNSLCMKFNEQLKTNEKLQAELDTIKKQLNKKEQKELENNLIIQGIPQNENENILQVIDKIGEFLNIPSGNFTAHRIGRDKTKGSPIKIVFEEKTTKAKWLKTDKKFQLKSSDLGYKETNKVYLNHDLTKTNQELYMAAKKFKQEMGYKYLWFANGNVLLKKEEGAKTLLVESTEILKN